MATNVSNRPYKEIEPLPEPIQRCPNLRLGAIRSVFALAIGSLCSAAGATFCLGTAAFTVLTGAVGGGVLGAVTGIFIAIFFINIPSKLSSYRVMTLEQMENTLSHTRALSAIKTLKIFFSRPLKQFAETYHNHLVHNEITVITERIDPQRPDLIQVWKAFLNHLHGRVIFNPNGQKVKLDFSFDLAILEKGEKVQPTIELIDPANAAFDRDFEEIESIQKESFGVEATVPAGRLKAKLLEDPRHNRCIVCRHETKVIGFAWMFKEGSQTFLAGIARRPSASRLGLGNNLLGNLLPHAPKGSPVALYVSEANPATRLFKTWGFEATESSKMVLNWKSFEETREKLTRRP